MMYQTTSTSVLALLLGSAAIGALVSSGMNMLGQRQERKSRREELVLGEAVKLGQADFDASIRIGTLNKKATVIPPIADFVARHHGWLRHLLDKGEMPPGYAAWNPPPK